MSGQKQGLIRGKDRKRVIRALIRRDGLVCYFCKGPITVAAESNTYERLSIHHVVERSEGGGNRLENLALAHRGCDNAAGGRALRPEILSPENPHLYHPNPPPETIEAAARIALMLKTPETPEEARTIVRALLNAAAKTGWYPSAEEE